MGTRSAAKTTKVSIVEPVPDAEPAVESIAAEEVIEDITPAAPVDQQQQQQEQQHEEDEDEEEEGALDDEDDEALDKEDIDSLDDGLFDPMQQFTQLLVTETGVPIVDVLQGIQDALEKQNKILYKLASVVDARLK